MLTGRRTVTFASLGTIALTLVSSAVAVARGATTKNADTIANVSTAGKAGALRIQQAQAVFGDAANVMSRMAADTTFQKTVLGYANKNDVAGLTTYFQKFATHSTVAITQLTDFWVTVQFRALGYSYEVCVADTYQCNKSLVSISIK
jgi:hypothetical protein